MSLKDSDQLLQTDVRIRDLEPLALDPIQAARSLAISERTLFSLTHPRGPIRAVKVGPGMKLNRYPVEELRRYLREKAEGNS